MNYFWQKIEQVIEEQKKGYLLTILGGEGIFAELSGKRLFSDGEVIQTLGDIPLEIQESIIPWLPSHSVKAERVQLEINLERSNLLKADVFIQPLLPPPTLLVLGGGHIALHLVELGKMMGFKITVVDDRPEFANPLRFPQADRVICADFAQTLLQFPITDQSYIVIVTRGHRYDQTCVESVIDSSATYLGMIGSKRRVSAMKNFLIEQGYKPECLERLHSPIGLNIGAETPAEIALSIMAEVVQCRRLSKQRVKHKTGELEIDPTVVKRLALIEQNRGDEQAVLATIVEVKGSAPRKSGAQMLFYADGRTVGTIGGGCAEAEVRRAALNILDQETPKIYTVDLTNDVAAEEGMVCGGIMKIFLAKI
jgi:xanthine dehydrogenase accessory factor